LGRDTPGMVRGQFRAVGSTRHRAGQTGSPRLSVRPASSREAIGSGPDRERGRGDLRWAPEPCCGAAGGPRPGSAATRSRRALGGRRSPTAATASAGRCKSGGPKAISGGRVTRCSRPATLAWLSVVVPEKLTANSPTTYTFVII
jgi:hypothetical protein